MKLSKLPHLLGDYLGGVARVSSALANGEANVAHLSRKGFVSFSEGSHGYGFIETVVSTFRELKDIDGLSDRMVYVAGLSFDDAIGRIDTSVFSLESLCSCEWCSMTRDKNEINTVTSRLCIIGDTYAIRQVAVIMSSVVQDSERPDNTAGNRSPKSVVNVMIGAVVGLNERSDQDMAVFSA